MQPFLSDDFLLQTDTARELYHEYAKHQPIFDYHCHLPPAEIAGNVNFSNLTQIWLNGDHYKWRAMRANGIDEKFITGSASDEQKFHAWAETVPKTLRNPLYQWTHLELKNPFGITNVLLNSESADRVYAQCNEMLAQPEFSTCGLLKQMNVTVVCTTDDPIDSLEHHQKIDEGDFCPTKVLPAFRPDRAMAVEDAHSYNQYLKKLEQAADISIATYEELLTALEKRHDYFHANGCRLSDHGLEQPYGESFTGKEIEDSFSAVRAGKELDGIRCKQLKTAILLEFARMDARKNWTQQFHFGALRNTNDGAMIKLGPDTGYDSIGDFEIGRPLVTFLNTLATEGNLAKTILYNLNPRDNELMATMIGNGLYPCVLASRILGGYALKGGMPLWKYIANRGLTLAENILFGAKLSEYHTGYRAYTREVLEAIDYNNYSDDFIFDNQFLAEILFQGFEVAEITCPTKYFEEASSINFARSSKYGLGVLGVSVKYFFKRFAGKK